MVHLPQTEVQCGEILSPSGKKRHHPEQTEKQKVAGQARPV